jgi:hypothetical protein
VRAVHTSHWVHNRKNPLISKSEKAAKKRQDVENIVGHESVRIDARNGNGMYARNCNRVSQQWRLVKSETLPGAFRLLTFDAESKKLNSQYRSPLAKSLGFDFVCISLSSES